MADIYLEHGRDSDEEDLSRQGKEKEDVTRLLSWYRRRNSRILDLGCRGGLHALELARCGHRVVGVDRQSSVVELARHRARQEGVAVEFHVLDPECDPLFPLGRFDLIYSLGNVLSHLPKTSLAKVLRQMSGCCAPAGIILFDLLIFAPDCPGGDQDGPTGIFRRRWSGQGIFRRSSTPRNFEVWGYSVAEVLQNLKISGFNTIDYGDALDFIPQDRALDQAVCLNFRAQL